MENKTDDGIALVSVSHPKGKLWRRILMLLRRPRVPESSLEVTEITISFKENKNGFTISRKAK